MQESLLPLLRCPVTRTALTLKVVQKGSKIFNGEKVEIIEEAVWLYFNFALSFREVEMMLQRRGLGVSYETIRQ